MDGVLRLQLLQGRLAVEGLRLLVEVDAAVLAGKLSSSVLNEILFLDRDVPPVRDLNLLGRLLEDALREVVFKMDVDQSFRERLDLRKWPVPDLMPSLLGVVCGESAVVKKCAYIGEEERMNRVSCSSK